MSRLDPGTPVRTRTLTDVNGEAVPLTGDGLVHLQFRRFAGCPICNLHLRSIVVRHDEIRAAGIREIAVFHSPGSELLEYAADLPFPLIADPAKRLYREFGVENGRRALLDPRAWATILRALGRSSLAVVRGRERPPAPGQPNGRLGLPADFLIGPDGRVLAAHYGRHAADQWPVDVLLSRSRAFVDTAGRA